MTISGHNHSIVPTLTRRPTMRLLLPLFVLAAFLTVSQPPRSRLPLHPRLPTRPGLTFGSWLPSRPWRPARVEEPRRRPPRLSSIRSGSADAGMSTAEYAVGTLAAVAFAGVLYAVVSSSATRSLISSVVQRALTVSF
ncbi:DUF4244 domain-containing protein [Frankia sp. Cpl3]|nr:DUF4244 domain-containing protein [Frankia sp. Cpl3]